MEVSYPSALWNGRVVRATEVRHRKDEFPGDFICIACGRQMTARTDGSIQRPHFGHSPNVACQPESYLHRLAKLRFEEAYKRLLQQGHGFVITQSHPMKCTHRTSTITSGCALKSIHSRNLFSPCDFDHDLIQRYTEIGVESQAGDFIADILLRNSRNPNDRILIEFCCTHQCTTEKRNSGERIIEIQIRDEADLEFLLEPEVRLEQSSKIEFINFRPRTQGVEVQDCICKRSPFRLFLVFKSGKAKMKTGTLDELESWYGPLQKSVRYKQLYIGSVMHEDFSYWHDDEGDIESPEETFKRAAWNALERLSSFKNCLLCRHRRKELYGRGQLYCSAHGKAYPSNNQAVDCDKFQSKAIR